MVNSFLKDIHHIITPISSKIQTYITMNSFINPFVNKAV